MQACCAERQGGLKTSRASGSLPRLLRYLHVPGWPLLPYARDVINRPIKGENPAHGGIRAVGQRAIAPRPARIRYAKALRAVFRPAFVGGSSRL
jgi:hypothetical protein